MPAPGHPPLRRSPALHRVAIALVTTAGLAAGGCSASSVTPGSSAAPAPSTQDAFRIAQGAQDPLLSISSPTFTFGAIQQSPYVCAAPEPCRPREGRVRRSINTGTFTRSDLAKYFVNNLARRGWLVEAIFCDPDRDEYVVLAGKSPDVPKAYPGRFELLAFDEAEARITVPAFGAENDFNLKPDNAEYPTGRCPAPLLSAFTTAREADGRPVATTGPGSSVPASTP